MTSYLFVKGSKVFCASSFGTLGCSSSGPADLNYTSQYKIKSVQINIKKYKLDGSTVRWIYNCLAHHGQRVVINGSVSQ